MKSIDAANALVEISLQHNQPLTSIVLQKELYIAHGLVLAFCGTLLVEEEFIASGIGPFLPDLWKALAPYTYHPIQELIPGGEGSHPSILETEVLQSVFELYLGVESRRICQITTQLGSPWDQAMRRSKGELYPPIPNTLIRPYFQDLLQKGS